MPVDAMGAAAPAWPVEIAKQTDPGRVRSHNEDSVDVHVPSDPAVLEQKGVLCAVADGMGGHQAGEVASRAAIDLLLKQYYSDLGRDAGARLVRAFQLANQALYDQARSDPSKSGMGTTLVAAAIVGQNVHLANVGDSRAYLVGPEQVVQITRDHSWVEEQVRAGLLSPEQARRHPQRSLVTRALGTGPAVEVDAFQVAMGQGDTLVLCTDGLTGRVPDPEIRAIVREYAPQEAAHRLVALANERGGEDNITVLIARDRARRPAGAAPGKGPAPARARQKQRAFPLVLGLVAVAAVALLGLGAVLLWPALLGGDEPAPTATAAPTGPAAGVLPDLAETPAATSAGESGQEAMIGPGSEATPSPQATPGEPTATLAPTFTPLPPTATPLPTPSPAATGAETATAPAGRRAPAPSLDEPVSGAVLQGQATFRWTHSPLPAGLGYQVLIWQEGDVAHNGAAGYTTSTEQTLTLAGIPQLSAGGSGPYLWSVVVVDLETEARLSPEAAPRRFSYTAPQPGGAKPPAGQPTEAPTTPPREGP